MSTGTVSVTRGSSPLVLSMPHPGTGLPVEVAAHLNARGKLVEDTDWHMRQLYGFAERFQPTIVEAGLSRFVIDLNRDPAGVSLYPGQATTELVPTTTFDGAPIWNTAPDEAEIARRREAYFRPYHDALAAEIAHAKAQHGFCLLWDCHSIKSVIPRLFPGTLPTLNLGTNSGASAAPTVEAAAAQAMAGSAFTQVVNGRFKGGWITRHYGQPATQVHALQMEIALSAYLDDEAAPWAFAPAKAASLQATLSAMIEAALAAAAKLERSKP
ncbi:N-formylglutamate deformylase [Bosea sp. 62]|uniref:N-formylglutamate deformylase n=1 Tax=unclassified Bosea (in: a-proteobacteria) TaxID=2653178 RepID=UPI00125B6E7F|nr:MULTISPECIES: N-formylglutamate deformylase [unclassified Bosea (in: a-proteobacteria)]CAD5296352.1 N-formylglutamate deformylase [Bosea sp. 7B]CAD5297371.1 N-formylglutamate deformylase [Bosea sp. 21B]CAD5297624.1 N-formylglutamate deformylase [Bosea sp. 46]VVT61280.1 N-formylglutamate deformylase [Bosea sp. EC-HK365B]VXB21780.1 N-formylglutamate deformylase [Bosea sp. 127]